MLSCSWWPLALQNLVHVIKVSHAARLLEQDTFAIHPIITVLSSLSDALGSCVAVRESVLGEDIVDALEYICSHDVSWVGRSVAAEAAGSLVALFGRNEGGKTLSRPTVRSVRSDLQHVLAFEGRWKAKPLTTVLPIVKRVSTMAISDANKSLMLESGGVVAAIVGGLLLSSPRRSEAGAEALQEACAGLLLSLALYRPWADALREDTGAMAALRSLGAGSAG
eukprot:SAG31_NODE_16074_length_724_cov_1.121600_1_plen_222_part_10